MWSVESFRQWWASITISTTTMIAIAGVGSFGLGSILAGGLPLALIWVGLVLLLIAFIRFLTSLRP